ncbi:hypothetical protein Trco_008453 [Trichoderma cornu-damae]|uniref:Myb-like domain-containing protein n=1 Tax=Trichoderma cornu-damae TaxID=654480 RepID=A0A9P8QIP5_9HYPO|nr:hypothetical protein Trco_008453 [Trichoderma cornu-damae]
MMTVPAAYTSKDDVARRQDQGLAKNRKTVLTGGGRAWSEDEEAYLIQTRLQKMPYKHIAAHLKKTELACRLHYHQLSHGSGRRKRASSVSSVSDLSLEMAAAVPSSVHGGRTGSVSSSSHRRTESYSSTSTSSSFNDVHLPRIMDSCASPTRLPAILPKPAAMAGSLSSRYNSRYLPPMHEELGHLPHVAFQGHRYHHITPPPAPPTERMSLPLSLSSTSAHTPAHVDLARLQAIYDAHRDAFWRTVAMEYGPNTSPAVLETAWKTGVCCRVPPPPPIRPITPSASPEAEAGRHSMDRTRIASILTENDVSRGRW